MRRNIWTSISLLVILTLVIASCSSKKQVAKKDNTLPRAETEAELLKNYELSNLNFHTFSGRAKANVQVGKETHNATVNVRMDRDRSIWISVTALLGIEAARVLITPDSVKIMNKIQGEYIAKPFSYIYNYTNKGISFRMLQDILVGNMTVDMLRTDQLQVATSTEDVQVIGIKDGLTFHYGVNNKNRPFAFNLIELGKSQKLETSYSEFADISGYNFPQRFTLNIEGAGSTVKADMLYNKTEFNTAIETPFSVPSRYKEIK